MAKPPRRGNRQRPRVVTQPAPAVTHLPRPATRTSLPKPPPPDYDDLDPEDDDEDVQEEADSDDEDLDDEEASEDDLDDEDLDEGDADDDADEDGDEITAASYLKGHCIPLPSNGKLIRLRPISLLSLIEAGQVPNSLLPAARRMVGLDQPLRRSRGTGPDGEDTIKTMNFLVCRMIASFKCVQKPQRECGPGEVSVRSILECDKNAIAEYAMKGQKALRSFRRIK